MLKGLKSNLITILTISMIASGGFLYTANNLNAAEEKIRQFISVTVQEDVFALMKHSNRAVDAFAAWPLSRQTGKR